MVRARTWWTILALAIGCTICSRSHVMRSVRPHPTGGRLANEPSANYFSIMKAGLTAENHRDFNRARSLYSNAIITLNGVFPDVRDGARVAGHNRIGTCYWKEGDVNRALFEFKTSLGLGDKKYAQKAIDRIHRGEALWLNEMHVVPK